MRTYKLETETTIKAVDNNFLIDTLRESYDLLKEGFAIYKLMANNGALLAEDCDYDLSDEDDLEEFKYEYLDKVEEFINLTNAEHLAVFLKGVCYTNSAMGRRLTDFFSSKGKLTAINSDNGYIPMSKEEEAIVESLMASILGNLAYFVYYQYDLNNVYGDMLQGNQDLELALPVYDFVSNISGSSEIITNGSLKEFIGLVVEVKNSCQAKMTIFDKYPEIEEPFTEIAGPFLQDVIDNEEQLTYDIAIKIIEGKLSIDEFVNEILESNLPD